LKEGTLTLPLDKELFILNSDNPNSIYKDRKDIATGNRRIPKMV